MNKAVIFILYLLSFGCNQSNSSAVRIIRRGDTTIKGNIVGDDFFNDTISYFGSKNELLSKRVYSNNKLYGIAVDYYSNGAIMSSIDYSNNLQNGHAKYFDSTGIPIYEDYNYYGLTVGPILFFDKSGYPRHYYFSNLQNENIFKIDYSNWKGIGELVTSCITFTINKIVHDSTKEISVLLYLPKPPKLSFDFSVYKKKNKSESDSLIFIKEINAIEPFKIINLPLLPSDENYAIGLKVYDSILNKQSVVYKDFP